MKLRKVLPLTLIALYITTALVWTVRQQNQVQARTQVKSAEVIVLTGNMIVDEINKARQVSGLSPLVIDEELESIARDRNIDKVAKDYYDHFSPDGKIFSDLMGDRKIKYSFACENLDLSFNISNPAFVQDWLESKKGHRECLLSDRVERIGVAITNKPVTGVPGALLATAIISD